MVFWAHGRRSQASAADRGIDLGRPESGRLERRTSVPEVCRGDFRFDRDCGTDYASYR